MDPDFKICKFNWIMKTVVAFTYIISYYNSLFETSLIRYLFYYILVFIENTGLMIFWLFKTDPNSWYRLPLFIAQLICFFIGLSFLVSRLLTNN